MDRTTLSRSILCMLFLAFLAGASADGGKAKAAVQSLGRIVYLPHVNSQEEHVSGRFIFDGENLLDLAKTTEIGHTDQHSMYFRNTEQLVQEIAREWGIKENPKEECFTVQSEFKRLVGPNEMDVNAAEVHAMRFHCKTYIPRDSHLNDYPLNNDFKDDFSKLPVMVKDAHDDRAWQPFRDFMKRWGSHIIETAYTGAAYQSWSSAKRSNNYNQQQLEARACLKAEGPNGHGLQACDRYNSHEREEAGKLSAYDTKRVRGGTRETRKKLEREMVTKELIEQFLREDNIDEQPVKFEFMPVWEFMLERVDRHSDNAKRALALQAYYEGWTAHGCPLVTTSGQQNNNAQMMVPEYNNDKKPTGHYLCIRRCQGCHDYNRDCHFEVGSACCRAYGPSALRRVRFDFVVRAENYDAGWCDADNGCKYSIGSGCHCEKSNEEEGCNYRFPLNPNDDSLKYKIIWSQKDSRPKSFESMLAMEK